MKAYDTHTCYDNLNYKIKLLPPSIKKPYSPYRSDIMINVNTIQITTMNNSASLNIGKDIFSVPYNDQTFTTLPAAPALPEDTTAYPQAEAIPVTPTPVSDLEPPAVPDVEPPAVPDVEPPAVPDVEPPAVPDVEPPVQLPVQPPSIPTQIQPPSIPSRSDIYK